MSHDTLKARLSDSVKDAMRAKATDRLATLRFLLAAIKQREVDERRELSDAEITAVIEKQVKQRRESIAAFEQAGRTETAEHEKSRAGRAAGIPAPGGRARGSGRRRRCRAGRSQRARRHGRARHGQGHGHPEAEAGRPRRHGRAVAAGQRRLFPRGARPVLVD